MLTSGSTATNPKMSAFERCDILISEQRLLYGCHSNRSPVNIHVVTHFQTYIALIIRVVWIGAAVKAELNFATHIMRVDNIVVRPTLGKVTDRPAPCCIDSNTDNTIVEEDKTIISAGEAKGCKDTGGNE